MANNSTNSQVSSLQTNDSIHYAYFSAESDIFPLLVAFLIVIINAWVIILILKNKLLRTVTNFILSSLAFSDLLTGLLSIPMFVACNVVRTLPLCITSDVFLRFTSISTVAHLLAVTFDRYLAIMHSLRYATLMTKSRALFGLIFIWVTSVAMSLIHFSWSTLITDEDVNGKMPQSEKENEIRYDIFCLITYFFLPLIFMMYAYGRIFYQVVRQRRIMTRNNLPGFQPHNRLSIESHKWKAAIIFLVMLLVYTICWLPYFAYRLQYNFEDGEKNILPIAMQYLIIYQRFCTSLFNPLLYILGKQDFRKTILTRFERRPTRSYTGSTSLLRSTYV
ncbi:histamine H2 receptor-like [Actinia tenebrosa]|uniref:Histamine H2 receptor-like n=1 Tax=Actinia tenebrosa TaxID=6105 RepID=A0A6P8H940_ACTTE|nr:histamine H2 receptor-like [Actinia tenebrosa]XP_031548953.1 histamine H2 receptor-like [Actinia tenebrosa]XP_031548954.1 histamine H2 receptor-like [Actinia tenebrosa]XP_031548955.1 histamine H2 receptor-like [Actinia tenebrosa]XP_031548956.1 histamine H2 receptor-like [Actinia tenebrosa]